jgi:sugar/nucleoside kinase (ribokinase family)
MSQIRNGQSRHDVLCIGNAIVDVIATADDDFLVREKIIKGAMNLIDEPRAEHLYKVMGPATITSGGSAANTAVGIAMLGGRAAYIGKVRDDGLGTIFRHDIGAVGVEYQTPSAPSGPATARSFIFVTHDGERSMNTYLGACQNLTVADVQNDGVDGAAVVYLEGYLWDPPLAKEAFRAASRIAHAAGREVALTLSDSFCVDRFRDEFLDLMKTGAVDIIFANESELKSLYMTADVDAAIAAVRNDVGLAVLTRSEKGAMAISRQETVAVPAFPIDELVDTTGAGDLFAAGFLFGYTNGRDLKDSLRLGAMSAAHVIQHIGPRPQKDLRALAAENGLG